jgi:L-alanine-DL-glutamate epimerase-like enolase superfamily enzyme
MQTIDPVIGGISYGEGGKVILPDGPGLGADIEPSFLNSLESFIVR